MKKKRLIFDVDGTLIPVYDFRKSIRKTLDTFKVPYKEENVELYLNAMQDYEKFYRVYDIKEYYEHIKKFSRLNITLEMINYYINHAENLVPSSIDDSIYDTLEYLKKRGYDLVVLTNYFSLTQANRLKELKLLDYFSNIYGGEYHIKPDILSFNEAAGNFLIRDCLMIGDSYEKDIVGARNAGMSSIFININGKYNDDEEINDFRNLKKVL